MAVGYVDPPGVADRAKHFGTVLVARWRVPSNSTNRVVELFRQPRGGRCRSASVHENELEAFVITRSGEVVKYLFDGAGLGRRSGDNAHAERPTRDVHADDALGAVGATVGARPGCGRWRPPFEAPRAKCVSITTIEGRGSFRPRAVRDDACSSERARAQVPLRDLRRNWDQTRVQGPNSSGRNRHWHPVCEI